MYNPDAPIAAIATPPGKGGVALIRVSGKNAVAVVAPCVRLRNGQSLTELAPRRTAYADFYEGGEVIDDVLVTVFRAPHSYTGEDTVEISCHGGILLSKTVLTALLTAGAVLAEPGEFTRRAVLSGRLSLTEAESIGSLLEAKSRAQISLSAAPARTQLSQRLSALRSTLLALISTLYAKIDYPEEDLADLSDEEICRTLSALLSDMDKLLSTYGTGHAINEGIPTVLCGAPNVGKSSLYNLLTGEDLAIVTEHAGTTRDVLSVTASAGRVLLHLSDTAGLRESTDPVEQIGVSRSRTHMDAAELLLAVFDGTRVLRDEDRTLLSYLKDCGKCVIAVINKTDADTCVEEEEIKEVTPHVIRLSAKTGDGREDLIDCIEALFTDEALLLENDGILSSARQHAALLRAREALERSYQAFLAGYPADLASSDLEAALAEFSALDGHTVNEEILNDIFSRFCLGK